VYYVGRPELFQNGAQLRRPQPDYQPSNYRGFSANVSASRDQSGVLAVTVQAYRGLDGGLCPDDGSTRCRPEVLFAYRDRSGHWCGSRGCSDVPGVGIGQHEMAVLNGDQTTPCLDGTPGLCWVDHIMPSLAALDDAALTGFLTTWIDFRPDPSASPALAGDDVAFSLRSAFYALGVPHESPAWAGTSGMPLVGQWVDYPSNTFFGDINQPVNARLHAHLLNTFSQGEPNDSRPVLELTSPFARAGDAP
jgi:hypothetical protein